MTPEEQEQEEQRLYEEALRATCSLCVLEGRCVCGELDPMDDDERGYEGVLSTECENDEHEDPDWSGHCIVCGKDLCKPAIRKQIKVVRFGENGIEKWYEDIDGDRTICNEPTIDTLWKQWLINSTAKREDDGIYTIFAVDRENPMFL